MIHSVSARTVDKNNDSGLSVTGEFHSLQATTRQRSAGLSQDPTCSISSSRTTDSFGMVGSGVAKTTIMLRIGGIAVLLLMTYFNTEGNQLLSTGWNYLKTQWWFRHDSLEPVVATLAFLPPLQFFYCIDMHSITPAGAWLNKYRIRSNGADMTSWRPYPIKELIQDPFKTRFMVLLVLSLLCTNALAGTCAEDECATDFSDGMRPCPTE
eukprot:m.545257 g.545257  ORF g.545257 m.545257 type:complete len:210 (-) comp22143_c2_seq3:37-666(-)